MELKYIANKFLLFFLHMQNETETIFWTKVIFRIATIASKQLLILFEEAFGRSIKNRLLNLPPSDELKDKWAQRSKIIFFYFRRGYDIMAIVLWRWNLAPTHYGNHTAAFKCMVCCVVRVSAKILINVRFRQLYPVL